MSATGLTPQQLKNIAQNNPEIVKAGSGSHTAENVTNQDTKAPALLLSDLKPTNIIQIENVVPAAARAKKLMDIWGIEGGPAQVDMPISTTSQEAKKPDAVDASVLSSFLNGLPNTMGSQTRELFHGQNPQEVISNPLDQAKSLAFGSELYNPIRQKEKLRQTQENLRQVLSGERKVLNALANRLAEDVDVKTSQEWLADKEISGKAYAQKDSQQMIRGLNPLARLQFLKDEFWNLARAAKNIFDERQAKRNAPPTAPARQRRKLGEGKKRGADPDFQPETAVGRGSQKVG